MQWNIKRNYKIIPNCNYDSFDQFPPLCHYHITFGNQHSSLKFLYQFCRLDIWVWLWGTCHCVPLYCMFFFVLLMMSQRTKNHPFYALLIFNFMHTIIFSIWIHLLMNTYVYLHISEVLNNAVINKGVLVCLLRSCFILFEFICKSQTVGP